MDRGEMFLGVAGVALALGSAAFATRMITDADYRPQFAGLDHLSIFSKPATHYVASVKQSAPAVRRNGVDPTPVGAIKQSKVAAQHFTLPDASSDVALMLAPNGKIERVARGSFVEGLGRVSSIEWRGKQWVVITTTGLVVQ